MAIAYEIRNHLGQTLRWVAEGGSTRATFGETGAPVRFYSPEGAERGRDMHVGIGQDRAPLGEVVPVPIPDFNPHW